MTTRTRLNVGSVGKMITVMTTMKLASMGEISLQGHLTDYVDPAEYWYWLENWPFDIQVADFMKMASGHDDDSPQCIGDDSTLTTNCHAFFDNDQTGPIAP